MIADATLPTGSSARQDQGKHRVTGGSDPGLPQCVEYRADGARNPGMASLEPHCSALEGVALQRRGRGLIGPGGGLRSLEQSADVPEQRLEQGAILRLESFGAEQFLVQSLQGVMQFAHGLNRISMVYAECSSAVATSTSGVFRVAYNRAVRGGAPRLVFLEQAA